MSRVFPLSPKSNQSVGTHHPRAHVRQQRRAQISYCPQNRMCSHRSRLRRRRRLQVLSHVPRPSDRFLSFTPRALRAAAKNFAGRRRRLRAPGGGGGGSPRGTPVALQRVEEGNQGGGGDGACQTGRPTFGRKQKWSEVLELRCCGAEIRAARSG